MNKEYVYVAGKVTVIDDKGEKREEEYYDNLDKVLIKENIIEQIEKQIIDLEIKSKQHEKSLSNRLFYLIPLLGSIVASMIGPLLVVSLISNQSITSLVLDSAYINYILALTIKVLPFGVFLGSFMSTLEYIQYRKNQKDNQGINSELEFLNKQLIDEKEELITLQNSKSINNKNIEDSIIKINDVEALKEIRKKIAEYYDLGHNTDKYYHYHQKGKLDRVLPANIDIDMATEYLEEKKQSLVKKKTKTK